MDWRCYLHLRWHYFLSSSFFLSFFLSERTSGVSLAILLDLYFCYSNYCICPQNLIKSMPSALEEFCLLATQSESNLASSPAGAAKILKKYLDAFPLTTRGSNLPSDAWDTLWLTRGPIHNLISMVQATVDWIVTWVWAKYILLIILIFSFPHSLQV